MAYLIITLIAFSEFRRVTVTRKYDHITLILQKLHRLLFKERIHFKILLITYKYINDKAPENLCELVSIRKSSRKLSSSSQIRHLNSVSSNISHHKAFVLVEWTSVTIAILPNL